MKAMPLPLANPQAQHDTCASASVFPTWSTTAPAPQPPHATAPNRILHLVSLWHLASLDAPTVAVVWSLAFAWAAGVVLPVWVPVLLALVTWSAYILDRLLDARSGLRTRQFSQLRRRHTFHWRHRRILLPIAAVAGLAAAILLAVRLPLIARTPDSLLAAATLAYFSGVHSRRRAPRWFRPILSKEFLVGLLFTVGCAVPAFTRLRASAPAATAPFLAILAVFAALAWLNCHAIARWEARSASPRTGIPLRAGLLALAALCLALLTGLAHPRFALLLAAAAASALLLALLDRIRQRLTPLTLRAAADLVLLAPAFLLLTRLAA